MDSRRRKCRLSNSNCHDVDLRVFEQIIIDTINQTVPGKNPKVFRNYFSTDVLTQSEAVSVGRALAKIDELSRYGKEVKTFRLFDGRPYESEEAVLPIKKRRSIQIEIKRKYVNIHEIQEEYLPISRKKIRAFVKKYMPVKYIGGRIYVERELLEGILADHDREQFPLS